MTRRAMMLMLVLCWCPAAAWAQAYTLQGEELVVTALPARSGETDCMWVDAGGRA